MLTPSVFCPVPIIRVGFRCLWNYHGSAVIFRRCHTVSSLSFSFQPFPSLLRSLLLAPCNLSHRDASVVVVFVAHQYDVPSMMRPVGHSNPDVEYLRTKFDILSLLRLLLLAPCRISPRNASIVVVFVTHQYDVPSVMWPVRRSNLDVEYLRTKFDILYLLRLLLLAHCYLSPCNASVVVVFVAHQYDVPSVMRLVGHSNPDVEYLHTKFDTRNTKNQKPLTNYYDHQKTPKCMTFASLRSLPKSFLSLK